MTFSKVTATKTIGNAAVTIPTTTTTTTVTTAPSWTDRPNPIDVALAMVSKGRGEIGATQNRFEHVISYNGVAEENLAVSESRIRDTDMAAESIAMSRAKILAEAAQAMLAQANQEPQSVLNLVRC